MRVKAKIDMPIEDYILLYKLAKSQKCSIGLFIRKCLANYFQEHHPVGELEKLIEKPLSEKEWNMIAKIKMHQRRR